MSNFNIATTDLLTEEEAKIIIASSLAQDSESAVAEHDMLVDATQLLSLGNISTEQLLGSAVGMAKEENSYAVGGVFDLFTVEQRQYGLHVASVTKAIQPSSVVSAAMVYTGRYPKARAQIMINSEMKTDGAGRSYYEFMRRSHFVASNVYTPFQSFGKKNGAQLTHKLYVRDARAQQFYTLKNGRVIPVALGSSSVFDKVNNLIQATGVVERYTEILNSLNQDFVETIADNQQLLFLNVFKTLKAEFTVN